MIKTIKEKFGQLKTEKFFWVQTFQERLMMRPFIFLYITLWGQLQILLAYRLHLKKPIVKAKTFWGDEMKMILPDRTLYFFGLLGRNELLLTDFVINNLKAGDVFIDVGANVGYYTLLASTIVGEGGQVHSFEPTPNLFEILQKNTILKRNTFLNQQALCDREGIISFTNFGLEYSGYNSVLPPTKLFADGRLKEKLIRLGKTISIKAVTLDSYCKINNLHPNFIKLDTEGSEYNILLGAEEMIVTYRPIVTVEIWDQTAKRGLVQKMIEFLLPYSYKCYQLINGFNLVPIKKSEDINSRFSNLVFLQKSV